MRDEFPLPTPRNRSNEGESRRLITAGERRAMREKPLRRNDFRRCEFPAPVCLRWARPSAGCGVPPAKPWTRYEMPYTPMLLLCECAPAQVLLDSAIKVEIDDLARRVELLEGAQRADR